MTPPLDRDQAQVATLAVLQTAQIFAMFTRGFTDDRIVTLLQRVTLNHWDEIWLIIKNEQAKA